MGNKFDAEYYRQYREKNKEKIKKRTRQWRIDNPDKMAAIQARYMAKHPYVSRKAPEREGCLITIRQEQIYRLVHPDFYNLPYWAAAKLIHVSINTICRELKRIKQKCPTLFPLRDMRTTRAEVNRRLAEYGNLRGLLSKPVSYDGSWMDSKIIEKF